MDATTVEDYSQALEHFAGSPDRIDGGVTAFGEAFADLAGKNLREKMQALYARDIYFNDTIHTFSRREDLVDYLEETGRALEESRVDIKQVIRDGNDVFVRWTMEFRVRAAGKQIHSHSIGMTHLRFDAEGRIVVHQDFWDSGNALYAHLPLIGFAIRRARKAMP